MFSSRAEPKDDDRPLVSNATKKLKMTRANKRPPNRSLYIGSDEVDQVLEKYFNQVIITLESSKDGTFPVHGPSQCV